MSFFHNLNKRLADLSAKQDAQQITESATAQAPKSKLAQTLNERDLGKHNNATTGFAALARKTGGGEKGARIAGAQLAKMRAKGQVEERDGLVEVTGDKPFDAMMGNIVKGAGGLKKKSSSTKFEQVYDLVEVLLLQDYFHSYLSDDISDALEKLKIKPTDELIERLGAAFLDRASGVLNFYNEDDMEESQQGMAEGSKDLTKELVRHIEKSSGGKDTAKRDAKGILQLVKNTNKKKGVAEAMPTAGAEYDDQATYNMAQQITAAIEKMTAAKSDINRGDARGTYQIVVNPSVTNNTRGYGTGQTGSGASVANISAAVGPYMNQFRAKGWMFTQPMQGQFTIGIPKQQAVAEGHCPACDCSPCECNSMEESAFQAAIGKKKYGAAGMKALQKAGREHAGAKTMSNIRNRYDKYDESQGMADEGNAFTGKLASTPSGGNFKLGNKKFKDTSSIEEGQCPQCDCTPCECNEGNAFSKAVVDAKRDGIQKGEKIRVGGKVLPLKELDMNLLKAAQGGMKGSNTDTESERNRHKKYGYRADREDTGNDDDYDEHGNLKNQKKAAVSDGPKKKGRPTKEKQPERVTAKSYKYKQGRPTKTKEGLDSDGVMMTRPSNMSSEGYNPSEYDQEGDMTKDSLHTVIRHAEKLEQHLQDAENLPTWVIEKIGQIKGMMTSVSDYIISSHERGAEQGMREPELDEEKVKAGKREFFDRLAPAARKAAKVIKVMSRGKSAVEEESTDKEDTRAERAGKKVAKDIEYNKGHKGKDDNKAEKAGKKVTKDIEYDDKKDRKKKKEEKVDETTTAGSVATATPSGKSGKGSMSFGKGVYEHYNRQFTQAMTESISIDSKMQECGNGNMEPGITITADGEEAAQLMMLLKLAGLESQIPQPCPTCSSSPCGCADMVDENSPDWPTNTETLAADPNLRTYSGGLNGPKSTGQSTTPVLAGQLRRQTSMEESVALERSLFRTWKNYKG